MTNRIVAAIIGAVCFIFAFSIFGGARAQVLSPQDRAIYRQIFDLQSEGNFKDADEKIDQLENKLLMGHLQAQRYMHPKYLSKVKELRAWLAQYPSNPEAIRIYNLARRKGAKNLGERPKDFNTRLMYTCYGLPEPNVLASMQGLSFRNRNIRRQWNVLYSHVRRGRTKAARNIMTQKNAARQFGQANFDKARAGLAYEYLKDNEIKLARDFSVPAAASSSKVPIIQWVNGLVSWAAEDYKGALDSFTSVAVNAKMESLGAGGAFWAARAALKTGNFDLVAPFLEQSSRYGDNFYSLIARRLLGETVDFSYQRPNADYQPTENDKDLINQIIALQEIGDIDMAKNKMRHIYLNDDDLSHLLLVLAEEQGMPYNPDQLMVLKGQVSEMSRSVYPIPEWQPDNGFEVDQALIFSFIRQESCFNNMAKSRVGARGLMQLMPQTAALVARSANLTDITPQALRKSRVNELHQPELNMALGQQYIKNLMNDPNIGDNLIRLMIAYNAGPGNLNKWTRKGSKDPLLFIETIPARETRSFVKKVIVNFWIYRSLLGQDNPSLDDIAAGNWPQYKNAD